MRIYFIVLIVRCASVHLAYIISLILIKQLRQKLASAAPLSMDECLWVHTDTLTREVAVSELCYNMHRGTLQQNAVALLRSREVLGRCDPYKYCGWCANYDVLHIVPSYMPDY